MHAAAKQTFRPDEEDAEAVEYLIPRGKSLAAQTTSSPSLPTPNWNVSASSTPISSPPTTAPRRSPIPPIAMIAIALSPKVRPTSAFAKPVRNASSSPATPASADDTKNTSCVTRRTSMPSSDAAAGESATARMLRPIRVRDTRRWSDAISASVTPRIRSCT